MPYLHTLPDGTQAPWHDSRVSVEAVEALCGGKEKNALNLKKVNHQGRAEKKKKLSGGRPVSKVSDTAKGLNHTQTHERAASRGVVAHNVRTGRVPAFEKFEEAMEAGDLKEGQIITFTDLRNLGIKKGAMDSLQMDLRRCTVYRLETLGKQGQRKGWGYLITKSTAPEAALAS